MAVSKGRTSISLCYIVKNEADELRQSLTSMRGQADEIIVVNTGNGSGGESCKAVAREFGAHVCDYDWRGDFASARNFALEQAHGDWVVFLDADEYFSDGTRRNVRKIIERADSTATRLLLVCLRNVDADTGREVVDVFLPRIFRNESPMRYVGHIHEVIKDGGADITATKCVPQKDLLIIHTGYSKSKYRDKCARNLRMMEAELPAKKNPEEWYCMLAEAHEGVGNFAQAIRYAKLDVARGRQPRMYASNSYRILLRLLSQDPHRWRERLEVARSAAADFPELPEFQAEYAECLAYALDFAGAVKCAELAETVACRPRVGTEPIVFDANMRKTLNERRRMWQKVIKRMVKVRITAGLIVKDGACDLPRWLDCARRAADDLLIVDTGSTDDSVALAEAAGATVVHFDWQGDFAVARNAVLDRAAGDWVLMLDADEWFEEPELVRPYLAQLDVTSPDLDAVMNTVVNIDEDYNNQEIHRFMLPRMVRCKAHLRYTGRVHECLANTAGALSLSKEPHRLHILHVGYSTSRIIAKHRRNLAIMLDDIAKHGDDGRYHMHMAKGYFALNDYEKSLHYAQLALKSPWRPVGATNEMYDMIVRSLQALKRPYEERMAWVREAVDKYPLLPDYHAVLGLLLLEREGNMPEADSELRRALQLYEQPEDTSGESSMFTTMLSKVHHALGFIKHHEGDDEAARKELLTALKHDLYNEQALNLLLELTPSAESVDKLTESLLANHEQREQGLIYISRFAEENGWLRLYEDCANKLASECGKTLPRTTLYKLLREGKPDELQAQVAGRLKMNVSALTVALLALERGVKQSETKLVERCESLLPLAMRNVWRAYRSRDDAALPLSADAYGIWWQSALTYGDDEQLSRLGVLALRLNNDSLHTTVNDCLDHNRWQVALDILGAVPADHELAATADFWRWVGICLYHLREPDGAAESFGKARGLGDESEELAMYEQWLRGDSSEGGGR